MILVTGASGFVGAPLVQALFEMGHQVRASSRTRPASLPASMQWVEAKDLAENNVWESVLNDVDCVIHCAARVHQMRESTSNAMEIYRRTNLQGTINLARQAATIGVRRFIFLSSIKVNGEASLPGQPFSLSSTPNPKDPYAITKWQAEQELVGIAAQTGMELVIIRPPLVYGPGVKANFETMIRWLRSGIPLPLGAIKNNRRSFVAIDNLISLLNTCIDNPSAKNQVFLVSDGEDVSTTELIERIAKAMHHKSWLLPVPPPALQLGARAVGKTDFINRLLGNLQVDISYTCTRLDWSPPVSVNEGLRRIFDTKS